MPLPHHPKYFNRGTKVDANTLLKNICGRLFKAYKLVLGKKEHFQPKNGEVAFASSESVWSIEQLDTAWGNVVQNLNDFDRH